MKALTLFSILIFFGLCPAFGQISQPESQPKPLPNVTVRVLDKETFEPIQAQILIVDRQADKQLVPVFEDRMYKYRIPVGDTTTFSIYADGYDLLNEAVLTSEINGTETFYLTAKTHSETASVSRRSRHNSDDSPKPALREDIISVLYFNQSTTNMTGRSRRELERIADYVANHENLQIDLAGHTDNVGDPEKNMALSRDRASLIRQHLITNRVSSTRVKSKGFGATVPVASNDSERTRKFNRRVVVKIVPGAI